MVFLTREERIKRRKLIRYRFRALIRKVYQNLLWLSELEDLQLGDDAQKNIAIILHRPTQQRGMLTIHDRRILHKNPRDRTADEREELLELFKGLSCFKDIQWVRENIQNFQLSPRKIVFNFFYHQHTLQKLTSVIELHFFDKGRSILKEGYRPDCMYFLVSGEILVSRKLYSKEDNEVRDRPMNIISAGTHFGHVALIYGTIRNSTCTSQSEFGLSRVETFLCNLLNRLSLLLPR